LENKFKIPVFLHDPKAQGGIAVRCFSQFDKQEYEHISKTHRDKCYILTVLTAGNLTILCDTLTIKLKSTDVFILKPLQVYSVIKNSNNVDAYLFCIEPFLLPNYCIDIFQNLTLNQQYVKIPVEQKNNILDTSSLLFRAFQEDIPNKTFVIKGLLDSLISRVAAFFMSSENYAIENKNQAYTLTSNFKKNLLKIYYFTNLHSLQKSSTLQLLI
jgi:AraC family transcriptional activator of pobA